MKHLILAVALLMGLSACVAEYPSEGRHLKHADRYYDGDGRAYPGKYRTKYLNDRRYDDYCYYDSRYDEYYCDGDDETYYRNHIRYKQNYLD